ncbi:uncharacterized protein LOC134881788 isoform X3 [Eleginops maclovinus]|uniref:uncharacterized protein LOC134881788 isoform X3 n=1 Tax=Eleginops maclovinus TaxID=56733 RepID=UPI003080396C
MLHTFLLLFLLCESTVKSQIVTWPTTTSLETSPRMTTEVQFTSTGWQTTTTARTTSLETSTPMTTEVAEQLGIAAFFFSLVALISIFAIFFWLGFQRHVATQTTSNTAAKGFPGPDKSPKGGIPPAESGGDVYMNYTGNDYSDLDLNNVTGNDYSSLS